MKVEYIFNIGSTYYWSFHPVSYGGNDYTAEILAFSEVRETWSTDLISTASGSFSVHDPSGTLSATDFVDEYVIIRMLLDDVLTRTWKLKVKSTSASYQKVKFSCVDMLQDIIDGDWPNSKAPRDIYVSDDPEHSDDYCIPVIIGQAYLSLRSVDNGTERYYVLGESTTATYTVSEVSTPPDWSSNADVWLSSEYAFNQSNGSGCKLLQVEIMDINQDGSVYEPGIWKPGSVYLDMPTKFSKSDTSGLTGPEQTIEYVLKDMGVNSADIDTGSGSTFEAAGAVYTTRGIEYNGGWTQRQPRKKIVTGLLAQCDSFLTHSEKIELRSFSATSVETFTNALEKSFSASTVIKVKTDGGTVKWQNPGKPQDILTGQTEVGTYTGQSTISNPDRETFDAYLLSDSQDAQRAGLLWFQKKLLEDGSVSFAEAIEDISTIGTLHPGQVITMNNINYGGNYDLVITSMSFQPLKVVFSGTVFRHLEDWSDINPSAVSIASSTDTAMTLPTVSNAPMIGIKKNTVSFDTTSNGYAYIHGFDNDGNAADIKGKITYDGALVYIPKTENSSTWTIRASQEGDGYMVFDTTLSAPWTVDGTGHSVVFAKLTDSQWSYDDGSAWVNFTRVTTDAVIGPMSVGSGLILSATVWPYGQDLGSIVDPSEGNNGLNSATILLHKRSTATPAKPTTESTYTFSTAILTGHDNGWTQDIPTADGNPLYVISAVATATAPTDTDTIPASEWSTQVQLAVDGVDGTVGADGYNQATLYLYQRGTSVPSRGDIGTLVYTFVSGNLSGSIGAWSRSVPAGTDPLYVTAAVAIDDEATDTIYNAEWSFPVIMAQDGADGSDGSDGADGANGADGAPGPGLVFRGTFAAGTYYYTDTRRDVVEYLSYYYLYNVPTGTSGNYEPSTISAGDWVLFANNFESVATKLLLAEDAAITKNLHVGGGTGSNTAGLSGVGSSSTDVRVWAGSSNKASAPWRVDQSGKQWATNINILNGGDMVCLDSGGNVTGRIEGYASEGALMKISGGALGLDFVKMYLILNWQMVPSVVLGSMIGSPSKPYSNFYGQDLHTVRNTSDTQYNWHETVDTSGTWWTSFYVKDNLAFSISENGRISATSSNQAIKDFVIDHPLDPKNKLLRYSSIEGPNVDLLHRGAVKLIKGLATVNIDAECGLTSGTFAALTQNAEITSLLAKNSFERIKGSEVVAGVFTIESESPDFDGVVNWVVIAERADSFIMSADETDENGLLINEVEKDEPNEGIFDEEEEETTDNDKVGTEKHKVVNTMGAKGYYLYPEAYGETHPTKRIKYVKKAEQE